MDMLINPQDFPWVQFDTIKKLADEESCKAIEGRCGIMRWQIIRT